MSESGILFFNVSFLNISAFNTEIIFSKSILFNLIESTSLFFISNSDFNLFICASHCDKSLIDNSSDKLEIVVKIYFESNLFLSKDFSLSLILSLMFDKSDCIEYNFSFFSSIPFNSSFFFFISS